MTSRSPSLQSSRCKAGYSPGASGDAGGLGPSVHEVRLSTDPKTRELQSNLIALIRENPGLQSSSSTSSFDSHNDFHSQRAFLPLPDSNPASPEAPLQWPLEWCTIRIPGEESVSMGSMPSTPLELGAVLEGGPFDAVIALLHPIEVLALGIQVGALGAAAEEKGKLFLQCPVIDGTVGGHRDSTGLGVVEMDQLKEAVRVLAALVRTGQRTLVCCTCGTRTSALVALCYLTFVAGMPLSEATALLRSSAPGAAPSLATWDEARTAWSSHGDTAKLAMFAQKANQRRVAEGRRGGAMDDWMAARQQLIVEFFNEQAQADVALAKVVSKVGAAGAPGMAGERDAAGGGYKAAAFMEAEMLRHALEERTAETKRLSAELAAAERQLVDAQVARKRAEKAQQQQGMVSAAPGEVVGIQSFLSQSALSAALRQEAEARERIEALEAEKQGADAPGSIQSFLTQTALEAALRQSAEAEAKIAALEMEQAALAAAAGTGAAAAAVQGSESGDVIGSFLAQSALGSALRQEAEAKERIERLEAELRSSSRMQLGAAERLQFLERETVRLREKEAAARTAAAEAEKEGRQLAVRLERTEASRAAAAGQVEELMVEVVQLREESERAEETEAKLAVVKAEVDTLSSELKVAREAAAAAKDKSEFLMRQVALYKSKLEAGAVPEVKVVVREDPQSVAMIAQLQAELREARTQALMAEQERDAALAQVSVLSVRLEEAEKELLEASRKLLEAEDKVGFLLRQVDATRVKRRAAEGALTAAKQQVKRMARNVDGMRQRLFSPTSNNNKTAEAAQALISTAENLYSRLEEQTRKLQASITASDQMKAYLQDRQKGNAGDQPDGYKIGSLADTVPGILAAAKAKAGATGSQKALDPEQEKLIQDVTCLREAVEALDSSKGEGGQPKDQPPPAVGLFNEVVKGGSGPGRVYAPASVPKGSTPQKFQTGAG